MFKSPVLKSGEKKNSTSAVVKLENAGFKSMHSTVFHSLNSSSPITGAFLGTNDLLSVMAIFQVTVIINGYPKATIRYSIREIIDDINITKVIA